MENGWTAEWINRGHASEGGAVRCAIVASLSSTEVIDKVCRLESGDLRQGRTTNFKGRDSRVDVVSVHKAIVAEVGRRLPATKAKEQASKSMPVTKPS